LTGPIARGDVATVKTQLSAFQDWKPAYGELYRLLGGVALDLSKVKGVAATGSIESLIRTLGKQ
jgi:predicted short-subunit dehydrogenase-like oxidoreductase (DUF2520 family)